MGFMSRKVLPACENMCVCCPALRPSSRQPVKRYKKLLAEIFPKATNGLPNERKITKLCEYAAKNPFRIPKIAKFLEQRSYKELRLDHVNFLKVISLAYDKLLCICKEQMAYFASSLLNVTIELLNCKSNSDIRVIGSQILTKFIYSQADSMYAHNIEALVSKVCILTHEKGEDPCNHSLQTASLECLSAMLWYMSAFSYIFADFDEMVHAILDIYRAGDDFLYDDERTESHLNWVEVIRSDRGCATGVYSDVPKHSFRPRLEMKNSDMTRQENENPKLHAQLCIQTIVEMTKESTTMRRILDPIFTYFDMGKHWDPRHGLAVIVLSDISHFIDCSGHDQMLLASVIRHLDHKNVVHDPQIKSDVIQIATGLVKKSKLHSGVAEVGIISDLCRHLRKSLQATVELVGQHELNWNVTLQNSIKDCFLEISKWINDIQPVFDMMTITLEEMAPNAHVARATIGSLLILAHTMSSSIVCSHFQAFPGSLFLQLLKTMMHPDVETRIGAHQIFSVFLVRSTTQQRLEGSFFKEDFMYEPSGWQSSTASALASTTALLEKLCREKESRNIDKNFDDTSKEFREMEIIDEEWKHSWKLKTSPNVYKMSSIIDINACSTSSLKADTKIMELSDDQIAQLLSAFWIQSNQPDNLPSNFEAIAHSFSLTLLSAHLKNPRHHNAVRMFQLPLSLRNVSLDHDSILPPSVRRPLLSLSLSMLMFGAKTYHIPELGSVLKSYLSSHVDPYLSIGDGDGILLCVKSQADVKEYGSEADNTDALSSLEILRTAVRDLDQYLLPAIVENLSNLTGLEPENLTRQLFETFIPEDGLLFGPNSVLDWFHNREVAHSDESLSTDEEFSRGSSVNGDTAYESPNQEPAYSTSKLLTTPSSPHVISVGQLLESALHVAGQVVGTSISTSPLPYGTMTSQCEALGLGTRKKLSSWLGSSHDLIEESQDSILPMDSQDTIRKIHANTSDKEVFATSDSNPWLSLRLPPASPFDNFLKAARY